MNHTSVHIYDRDVDPVKIFLIKPFDPGMFDPGHLPYDDLNATLIVARRPFRLIARRPVKMLAELLGFHYLEKDNIAVNPRMKVTIESCLADSCAGLRPQPRSLLTISYHGITHRHRLTTAPEEALASIVGDGAQIHPQNPNLRRSMPSPIASSRSCSAPTPARC